MASPIADQQGEAAATARPSRWPVIERSLRDRRRSLTSWALGIAVYVALIVAFWPSIRGSSEISKAIEETTFEQKGLYPNVDFYAASVYHVLGIPTDLMTPIFAAARMAGWTAHVREQYQDNKVIRPASVYVGPRDRTYTPIEERDLPDAD